LSATFGDLLRIVADNLMLAPVLPGFWPGSGPGFGRLPSCPQQQMLQGGIVVTMPGENRD